MAETVKKTKQIKTYIAEALSSEKGTKFGKKGDQKDGKEVKISEFRDFGFTKVYRFKNAKAGILCAKKAVKIAESDLVGYSQALDKDGRASLYDELERVGFIAGNIENPVNTDCSAMAAACVSAVSEQFGASYKISKWSASGNIGVNLMLTNHFKCLNGLYYRKRPDLLREGDILVAPCKHVAIVVYRK